MARKTLTIKDLSGRPGSPSVQAMIGRRYGSLTVKSVPGCRGELAYVLCECECGCEYLASSSNVLYGRVKSCGCRRTRMIGESKLKHGHAPCYGPHTLIYGVWKAMRERCGRREHGSYKNYGGRGIRVCDRWHNFENFLADMGEPAPGMTLDRIDNNGDYTPENCRWATRRQQAENQRTNWHVSIDGEEMTAAEATRRLGWKHVRLYKLLYRVGASKPKAYPIDDYIGTLK